MEINITQGTFKGRISIVMESKELKAVILPELGSKMVSLTFKDTGREFLYQGPRQLEEYKLPKYGDEYGDYDISGFDECIPAIEESPYPFPPYQGEIIPNHGEVWSQGWDYQIAGSSLEMWVKGIRFPYRIRKKISFTADSIIRSDYMVENMSQDKLAFIWAPHILLNCNEQTKVLFPEEVKEIIQSRRQGSGRLGEQFHKHSYPVCKDIHGKEYRLDRVYPLEANDEEKFYSAQKVKEGWCAIHHTGSNEIFGLSYPSTRLPYLGLWISSGGFMHQHVIALEPTNVPMDTLESAYRAGYPMEYLAPLGKLAWYLNISVKKSEGVKFINDNGAIKL